MLATCEVGTERARAKKAQARAAIERASRHKKSALRGAFCLGAGASLAPAAKNGDEQTQEDGEDPKQHEQKGGS